MGQNLNANQAMTVQQASALLEQNGVMVYQDRRGGYVITTPEHTRDGFTARAIITMAQNLKPKRDQ
jgi:DNA-binding GntR family transcriptional regulator